MINWNKPRTVEVESLPQPKQVGEAAIDPPIRNPEVAPVNQGKVVPQRFSQRTERVGK